jgi:hypothetical protein
MWGKQNQITGRRHFYWRKLQMNTQCTLVHWKLCTEDLLAVICSGRTLNRISNTHQNTRCMRHLEYLMFCIMDRLFSTFPNCWRKNRLSIWDRFCWRCPIQSTKDCCWSSPLLILCIFSRCLNRIPNNSLNILQLICWKMNIRSPLGYIFFAH